MRFLAAFLLLFLVFSFKNPQTTVFDSVEFPRDYFASPVAGKIKMNGCFGELRPDHFHAGLDIDSHTGGVGEPIFAAADGYIDRIKVSSGGYGNGLYLRHPNGFKTVYGHLDEFTPEINRFVKQKQYEKESFSVDIDLKEGQFPVKKGQEIGKLGNSGGSSGPHLHFEIRDAKTDHALNPLLFNFGVEDATPPTFRELKAYFLNDNREEIGKKPIAILKEKGVWKVKGDTVRLAAWRFSLGLKAYDFQTGQNSNLGLYDIRLLVDDDEQFHYRIDEIDFDDTRYVNAHMDYAAKKAFGVYFHRLWVLSGNKLPSYTTNGESGVIEIFKDKPRKITIIAADALGNESKITFFALRDENMPDQIVPSYNYAFDWQTENSFQKDGLKLEMQRGSLYENLYLKLDSKQKNDSKFLSFVHQIQDNRTPVHRYFPISIKPENAIPAGLKSKAYVAYMAKITDKPQNAGGKWEGDWLTTRTRSLGNYAICYDDVPPTITPIIFKTDLSKSEKMSFRIGDNVETTGTADGLDWRATVDGNWILMEFDGKKDRLTHVFDEKISAGEHTLRIVVKDNRGNSTVFERNFIR
jgi:Peptidase family M23